MDQVEIIIQDVVSKRALLFEQFMLQHQECWPGVSAPHHYEDHLVRNMKCTCGAQLEVTILTKLVVNSYCGGNGNTRLT